jgi:hypothetical protein
MGLLLQNTVCPPGVVPPLAPTIANRYCADVYGPGDVVMMFVTGGIQPAFVTVATMLMTSESAATVEGYGL